MDGRQEAIEPARFNREVDSRADDQPDVLLAQVGYVIIVQEEARDPPSGPGRRSARGYLVHDHFNPDVAAALVGTPLATSWTPIAFCQRAPGQGMVIFRPGLGAA
jgi:hypothetical protein